MKNASSKKLSDLLNGHDNKKNKPEPKGKILDAAETLYEISMGKLTPDEMVEEFTRDVDSRTKGIELIAMAERLNAASAKILEQPDIFFFVSRLVLALMVSNKMEENSQSDRIGSMIHAIGVFLAKLEEDGLIKIKTPKS